MQTFGSGTFGSGTFGGSLAGRSAGTATATATYAVDALAPSAPGAPVASNITDTTATVSWGAATDDVGVTSYDVLGVALNSSRFSSPEGVAIDASGALFVGSSGRVARLTAGGMLSSFVGSLTTPGYVDATGSAAMFNYPAGLAFDSAGTMYVADRLNYRIRKVTTTGVVSTLAGSGAAGAADGTGIGASFGRPYAVACDSSGNVYVADPDNFKIRKITPAGVVTTFLGSGVQGTTDGTGTGAALYDPIGLAFDGSGNLWFADYFTIRKATPAGVVTTMAGAASTGGYLDATGTAARFTGIYGICFGAGGNLLIADFYRIRSMTPALVVSTLAGSGSAGYADGTGIAAGFSGPRHLVYDARTTAVYITDVGSYTVRKLVVNGSNSVVTTIAGLNGVVTDTDTVQTGYVYGGNALSTTVTGLTSPATYSYVVFARDATGKIGPPSDVVTFSTLDLIAPSTPSYVAPTAATATSVTLGWTVSTDNSGTISGYQVYVDGTYSQTVTTTAVTYTMAAGESHSYAVKAVDPAANTSTLSAALSYTQPNVPAAPTGLTAIGRTAVTAALSWNPSPETYVVDYDVRRDGTVIQRTTVANFIDAGLVPGSTHSYDVRVRDLAGNVSAWSGTVTATTPAGSSTATLIRAQAPAVVPAFENGYPNSVAWSPSGAKVALTSSSSSPYLTVYNRAGSVLTRIADPATLPNGACAAHWSPDGALLVVARTSANLSLYSVSGDVLTSITAPSIGSAASAVAWSPDGQYLALAGLNGSTSYLGIYKRSGTTLTKITDPVMPPGTTLPPTITWSPESRYLAVSCNASPYLVVYARSGDLFTKLTVALTVSSAPQQVAVAPDGRYIALTTTTNGLLIGQLNGSGSTATTSTVQTVYAQAGVRSVSWSPDGQNLILATQVTPFIELFTRTATHANVRAATTGNITLSGLLSVDGVATAAGDRVLVASQSTATQNGIYVVAAGAWSRSADANTAGSLYRDAQTASTSLGASAVFVTEGTTNGGKLMVMTSSGTGTQTWTPGSTTSAWSTGVLRRAPSPTTLPASAATGIGWSPTGNTIVEHNTSPSPYISEYVFGIGLAGTTAGTATAAGDLSKVKVVPAGSTAGAGTATATMSKTAAGGVWQLAGTATGKATVTATISRRVALAATATGKATVTATIGRRVALAASAAGVGTDTATISRRISLAASAAGAATTTASIGRATTLAGAATGKATVTATATISHRITLAGGAAGTATVTATITRHAGISLAGQAAGAATLSAAVTVTGPFGAAAHGFGTATAALTRRAAVAGTYAYTWYVDNATTPPPPPTGVRTLAALGAG